MLKHQALAAYSLLLLVAPGWSQSSNTAEFVFHRIRNGPIRQELTERGEVQPVKQTPVVCQLRSEEGAAKSSSLVWLIEDGSMVKKGEIIAKLDDSKLREALQKYANLTRQKKAELTELQEERDIVKSRVEFDIENAELSLRLIELEVKESTNEQSTAKLKIKKRMAELAWAQVKREAATRIKQADARLEPAQHALSAATDSLNELERQLQFCQITAPHDGFLTYHAPETSSRFGGVSTGVISLGEPIKEGQRLFTISDLSKFHVVCRVHESIISKVKAGMKAKVNVLGQEVPAIVSSISITPSSLDWMASDVKVYPVRLTLDSTELNDSLRASMSAQVSIQLGERANAVQIPIQAVREERGMRYCYIRSGKGIEKRIIKTGIYNTQTMEVTDGLKAGDEVVMNPPRRVEPKENRGPVVPDPKPQNVLLLRSIRPSSVGQRRSFVERYGLSHDDLDYVQSMSPALVAPVRQSSAEVRDHTEYNAMTVPLLGITPEFACFHPSLLADIDGRFLCDHDSSELVNAAVIGKTVADKLFPRRNSLGETLRISGKNKAWIIVGVLSEQHGGLDQLNEAMLLPYASETAHYGETKVYRASGTRGTEIVPYTHILLQPASGQSLKQTAQIIRSRLEATHAKEDWRLISSEDR